MNAESIVAVAAGVVAVTQLVKWAGLRDAFGPLVVIVLSGLGVMVWLYSQQTWPPVRTDTWGIASGWVTVTLSAAGAFGFTRAAAGAITRATPPPDDGAGSSGTAPSVTDVADEIERRLRAERSP